MTIGLQGCSLSGQDLFARIAEWRTLAAHATARRVAPGEVVSTYPRDDALRQKLNDLIAAEATCCSFMTFDVQERGDEIVVALRVPDEMAHVLEPMLGAVTTRDDAKDDFVSS